VSTVNLKLKYVDIVVLCCFVNGSSWLVSIFGENKRRGGGGGGE
jgi:hypothetical protein